MLPYKTFKIFSAIAAAFLWGSWAFYINYEKANGSPIVFALAQGAFSFVMTLVLVKTLESFKPIFKNSLLPDIAPIIATLTITSSILISIHMAIKTPDLINTILAPLFVAFVFCLVTVKKLTRKT